MRSRVYIVTLNPRDLTASFIKAHIDHLPAEIVPVWGYLPGTNSRPALSQSSIARLWRKVKRSARRQSWDYEISAGYLKVFNGERAAVLAEYGPNGVRVMEACAIAGIPLIVHFHGYDASVKPLLEENEIRYKQLFKQASAVVAVSRAMQAKLIDLGAPPEKVVYNPYGVDCDRFRPGDSAAKPPTVLAAGYFVEKKAPHLTILSFAKAQRDHPEAKLRMVGNGPLLSPCRDLVTALELDHAVTFLGEQPHGVVQEEMRRARCFVQHSIEAQDGNSEGLPNVILEAGASGLPVVSTRHAGIVDAVLEGETGLLVAEKDVNGMADRLSMLLADPERANAMGRSARQWIEAQFSMQYRTGRLWSVIEASIERRRIPVEA